MFTRLTLLLALATLPAHASFKVDPRWTTNHTPFHIAGNLYYVGSEDLCAYLITTPQGNILINANLPSSPELIRKNIEALGFRFEDTKILLNSQAHFDHIGGAAEIKRLTHAKVETMEGDVSPMESGGKTDFYFYNQPNYQFEPVKVDRILHDGDTVTLGGTTLTAHRTAGHTKGDTTWTFPVTEAGHTYNVLIYGGAAAINENILDDPRYPTQSADFKHTFEILPTLPCDIFLGAHGVYFGLTEKYKQLQSGNHEAFIDSAGYKALVNEQDKEFEAELAKEKAARTTKP